MILFSLFMLSAVIVYALIELKDYLEKDDL